MTWPCARQLLPLTNTCRHCENHSHGLTRPGDGRRDGRFPGLWIDIHHPTFPKRCASVATCGDELPTYSCGYSSGVTPAFPFNLVAEAPSGKGLSAIRAHSQARTTWPRCISVARTHHAVLFTRIDGLFYRRKRLVSGALRVSQPRRSSSGSSCVSAGKPRQRYATNCQLCGT